MSTRVFQPAPRGRVGVEQHRPFRAICSPGYVPAPSQLSHCGLWSFFRDVSTIVAARLSFRL